MSEKVYLGKVFLLITGASQGIGEQFAETFGSQLDNGSHVFLVARNSENLKNTAKKLPENIYVS